VRLVHTHGSQRAPAGQLNNGMTTLPEGWIDRMTADETATSPLDQLRRRARRNGHVANYYARLGAIPQTKLDAIRAAIASYVLNLFHIPGH
jgi:hypothetical protein